MTVDLAMWLLGIASLSLMAAVSAYVFADAAQQWHRIWSTMLGRHLPTARRTPITKAVARVSGEVGA